MGGIAMTSVKNLIIHHARNDKNPEVLNMVTETLKNAESDERVAYELYRVCKALVNVVTNPQTKTIEFTGTYHKENNKLKGYIEITAPPIDEELQDLMINREITAKMEVTAFILLLHENEESDTTTPA